MLFIINYRRALPYAMIFCPFRAMDTGKIVTRRVAAGWGMLPLAGRKIMSHKKRNNQKNYVCCFANSCKNS
ncbi:MAG: hypothetical protein LBQ66_06495, partial [Planctomycetaceae bacterium]|nr:hypothetical protein [Planctomycetaceae bacterium]